MFKRFVAVALALLGASYAADARASEMYNWSGAYAGVHLGYGWADPEWNLFGDSINRPLESMNDGSVLGGVQLGYQIQRSNWVFGVDASISGSQFKSSADACEVFCVVGTKVDWTGDVAGRVGYAFDRSLVYVRGGAALADVKSYYTFGGLDPFDQTLASDRRVRIGWTLGAGLEYGISRHISASVDYRYSSFGTDKSDIPGRTSQFTIAGADRSLTVQTVMVGLNYRF